MSTLDICPECGSGHTVRRVGGYFKWYDDPIFWFVHYHCTDCFSRWSSSVYESDVHHDQEPHLTDLCPKCGSGHTTYFDKVRFAFWRCDECGSKWCSRDRWSVEYQIFIQSIFDKDLPQPKLSDMVEP